MTGKEVAAAFGELRAEVSALAQRLAAVESATHGAVCAVGPDECARCSGHRLSIAQWHREKATRERAAAERAAREQADRAYWAANPPPPAVVVTYSGNGLFTTVESTAIDSSTERRLRDLGATFLARSYGGTRVVVSPFSLASVTAGGHHIETAELWALRCSLDQRLGAAVERGLLAVQPASDEDARELARKRRAR